MYDAIIIGGGAAGLMAACRMARAGMRLLIVEQSDRVGRKLLSTGNGRCNLLNMRPAKSGYFSRDMDAAASVMRRYPPAAILAAFGEMGLAVRTEEDGRVYPLSGQAASVLDTLRLCADEANVTIRTGAPASDISRAHNGWNVLTSDGNGAKAARVILACGGRAQPTPPEDRSAHGMDMLEFMRSLGHRIYRPEPVLTPLICDMSRLRGLKGVRVRGALALIDGKTGRLEAREAGEMLFADYGLSGIAAMQLSRRADARRSWRLELDFLPEYSEAALADMLFERARAVPDRPAELFLTGILNRMLAMNALKYAGINPSMRCGQMNKSDIARVTAALKAFEVDVNGAQDFKSAQAMRGGAALCDFDRNLMSRHVKGLYACGEILDVDGACGGYNLMWAWASAMAVADGILSGEGGTGSVRGKKA